MERKFSECERDAPDRCQAVHPKGQCLQRAVEGSKYCARHGGNGAQEMAAAQVKRQYQLAKWQARVDEFADEDAVKSLRAEIGITRLLLETQMNKCRDAGELLLYSSKIGEMISRIEKLVVSCHRLESNLGLVLDKSRVVALAAQIVEIISRHVTDDDAISRVSTEIVNAIVVTQGATKDG